ncbi:hypothetical protein AOLI_G00235200 [Acnodon oligacanthus]
MGQVHLLWITAALLSSPLLTLCDPLYIFSAPQIMTVGIEEQVFVEVQDRKAKDPLNVNINVMTFPSQQVPLYSSMVTLKPEEKFQALVGINQSGSSAIPFDYIFEEDINSEKYVYLKATFDGIHSMEKIVMVSIQLGYIFIQTDKTIYTPDNTVLPSFEVKLTPERSFYYTGDETFPVEIKAMYLFGQEVQGSAFAVFGLLNEGNKTSLQSSLARVDVYVTNPDETPAKDIQVLVTPENVLGKTDKNGIVNIIINTQKGDSSLNITVLTLTKGLGENKVTVHAYEPRDGSQNYLHIERITGLLKVGDHFTLKLNKGPGHVGDQDLTCMVLSKGRIITASRHQMSGNAVIAVPLTVTKEMLPSFRVVAYYHVGSSEVVADSIWVDVEDTCMGSLKLDVKDANGAHTPNELIDLKITGDPGAKVSLVAVDKGIYVLNNKNILSQTKIWDTIEQHDLACTAGSGKDSMGVFYDAGLLFMSNSAGSTPDRRDLSCPSKPKRKQRDVNSDILGEDQEDDQMFDIVSRSFFPESWLWQYEMLPTCEDKGRCEKTLKIFLPHHITTWVITAISTSADYGICVADPMELMVQKPFFVDLKLPYSAVVNEQIEINTIIHNFGSSQIKQVIVELLETENVCSLASYKKKYRTTVSIAGKSSRAVPFVIIPLAPGQYDIEVMVRSPDAWSDGLRKTLNVLVVTGHTKPYPVGVKCKNFDLDVKFTKMETISYDGALASYTLSVGAKFLKDRESTMTVLDIGLLTGFVPDTRDLLKLTGTNRHIQGFELDKISDRGSLIINLKKVSNVVKETVTFRIHKNLHVGLLQPARIKVYEYNDKENHCVKFYDAAERTNGMLRTICPTDVCSCAEVTCDLLKGPEVPAEDKRTKEACQRKDFAYKATLKDIKRSGSADIYAFSVIDILKEGYDPVQPQEQRNFWAHSQCKEKLNLKMGKDYLIMGPKPKKIEDSYLYLFGVWTWLEYWPTTRESHENMNNDRERYNGLAKFSHYLQYTGCTT